MSTRKTSFIIILGIILSLVVSYCPLTALAEHSCEDEGCYRLTVKINGFEDYIVHDELVMVRYFGGNESSPVLYENRTITDGVAYFCIEDGEYWIDVRNVWARLTIDNDIDFVFPYLLFADIENSSNDEDSIPEPPSKSDVILWLGIAVVIFAVMILSLFIVEKKKKK